VRTSLLTANDISSLDFWLPGIQSKYFYFREYTIDWDDNDPTGRKINFQNVALDVQPDEQSIDIGTVVLFKQG